MDYKELKEYLAVGEPITAVEVVPGVTIEVSQYLPIEEKAALVQEVVNASIDEQTGCFSPVRVNVYFAIGMLIHYCKMSFEDENIIEAYDLLEQNGVIDKVLAAIPDEERGFIETLVNDTIEDISRYNSSLAGMISAMSDNANNLDGTISDILEKIKNREGMEMLAEIKNMVGTD